ncbi:ORC5 like AAA+ ATPase [Cryptosporidium canis]|uniref:ORC5 like AAA+ ATPase n=1 Tax=Cryptosporidium canis TaxID=195482 RepID=A0ABQ8PA92_9CRYT|nr:ORC5 like AAA+ ATPase [Cryptosporidium canis]KAJ1614353.1 ORC5 like AAA+ ATPase [Cryptosporidium canis]
MSGEKRKRTSRGEPRDCEQDEDEPRTSMRGFHSIESSKDDLVGVDANEQVVEDSVRYYAEEIRPTIRSLCRKYGSSRFQEIFQLAGTIGSQANPVPYLQVLGMPGTGKYSLVRDMLRLSGSVFGYINGSYTKWLCGPRGGSLHKISVDNLFTRPVEQIRRKLVKSGIFSAKRRSIIDFVEELRLIRREYLEYLHKRSGDGDDQDAVVSSEDSTNEGGPEAETGSRTESRYIFLVVKDVTAISKNRPDLLLTLMRLHEHLRDVVVLPAKRERFTANVGFCVIFIDNFGIPEDFFCSHTPFPVIWFSSYGDIQTFDILANLRLNSDIREVGPGGEALRQCDRSNARSILVNTLLRSYVKGSIDYVPKSETDPSGIRLNLTGGDADKHSFIPMETLQSIWTEFVAELTTLLHPYIKSDFREIIFKTSNLWPVFLLPLVSGQLYLARNADFDEQVGSVTQTLLKLFRRHYGSLTKNVYSHYLPQLLQGDLISSCENSGKILNYGFMKSDSQVSMPYFAKLLLVSAYVASKVPKKDDKTLFNSLVASKVRSRRGRRRPRQGATGGEESKKREAFSLIRWLAVADCIALHITGDHGIELSVPIFEQISEIIRVGLVIPATGKWSQLILSRGELGGPLHNISPLQDLSVGQNIGVEMAMYRQGSHGLNSCPGFNHSAYSAYASSLKLSNPESPINMEDPRALYMVQAPFDMIEAFSVEIGVILSEVIPESSL